MGTKELPKKAPKKMAARKKKVITLPAAKAAMSGPIKGYQREETVEFEELLTAELEKQRGFLTEARKTLKDVDSPKGLFGESEAEVRLDAEKQADRAGKLITHLESALVRIKTGTYGICRVTGQLIPKERLRLVPHATTTVAAKQQEGTPGFAKKYLTAANG